MPCTYHRPLKRGRATRTVEDFTPSRVPEPSATAQGDRNGLQYQIQDQCQNQSREGPRFINEVNGEATSRNVVQNGTVPPLTSLSDISTAHRGQTAKRDREESQERPGEAWRAFATASAGTIEYLVQVYLQVAFPM